MQEKALPGYFATAREFYANANANSIYFNEGKMTFFDIILEIPKGGIQFFFVEKIL